MSSHTVIRLPSNPFLDVVRKSGLLTPDDLVDILSQFDPEQVVAANPIQMATFLVRKKLLTKFQAMQLLNGRTRGFILGPYRVLEGIRQDRVGMVFLAEHAETKGLVSLKLLPTDRISDKSVYTAFIAEVEAAERVSHANVARIIERGVSEGMHYVVTEYVRGVTLDKVVAERGPLAPNAAAQLVAQVAIGLKAAHAARVLHRDIKPGNISVLPDGRVKILDLGLTHMLENPWQRVTQRINMKEYAEEIAHIAPEQAWGSELDVRSDIYSLGSTFYYLITAQPPFPGAALASMSDRQVRDIPEPSRIRPEVSKEIDDLIVRMGAKDPRDRIASASALIAAMQDWLPHSQWAGLGLPNTPKSAKKSSMRLIPTPKPAPKPVRKGLFARLGDWLRGR